MDLCEIAEKLDYQLWNTTTVVLRRSYIESALRSVAPRWVPVEEGLPEPFASVIVWITENQCFDMAYIDHEGVWDFSDGDHSKFVTHWLPLPPPPEGCKEP